MINEIVLNMWAGMNDVYAARHMNNDVSKKKYSTIHIVMIYLRYSARWDSHWEGEHGQWCWQTGTKDIMKKRIGKE